MIKLSDDKIIRKYSFSYDFERSTDYRGIGIKDNAVKCSNHFNNISYFLVYM